MTCLNLCRAYTKLFYGISAARSKKIGAFLNMRAIFSRKEQVSNIFIGKLRFIIDLPKKKFIPICFIKWPIIPL